MAQKRRNQADVIVDVVNNLYNNISNDINALNGYNITNYITTLSNIDPTKDNIISIFPDNNAHNNYGKIYFKTLQQFVNLLTVLKISNDNE